MLDGIKSVLVYDDSGFDTVNNDVITVSYACIYT